MSLSAPVPGGQFKLAAPVQSQKLWVQVTAQALNGSTLSKTFSYPASEYWGDDFTWTI